MIYKNTILNQDKSISEAILNLNLSGLKIIFVVDIYNRLLGTVTDGDIRRAILKKIQIDSPIKKIMNKNPKFFFENNILDTDKIFNTLKINAIPILNKKKIIIDIIFNNNQKKIINKFYIIAGGKGTRMMPLTKNTPKPMLSYEGTVIIDRIIEKAMSFGFVNFYISINYLGKKIKKYLEKYKKRGLIINFIEEKRVLGTAGSLSSFYENKKNHPFLITNADLITNLDYNEILNFHIENKADATVGIKTMYYRNPYGVVKINNIYLSKIEEKPTYEFNVNAGIYVFNPGILKKIKKNKYLDIPDFLNILINEKKKILIFPIYENWKDLQTPNDLK